MGLSAFDPYCKRHNRHHGRKNGYRHTCTQNIEGTPQADVHPERWPGELVRCVAHGHAIASTGSSAPSAAAREFTTSSTVAGSSGDGEVA